MFDINADEKAMAILEGICNQPIDNTPFNVIRNPKPLCENKIRLFGDVMFDTEKWSAGSKTVKTSPAPAGKGKTAPEKDVKQDTEVKAVKETKEATANAKAVTQSVTTADPTTDKKGKGENDGGTSTAKPATQSSFDKKASAARSDLKGAAEDNQKLTKGGLTKKNADLLAKFVQKIGTGDNNKKVVDGILSRIKTLKDGLSD